MLWCSSLQNAIVPLLGYGYLIFLVYLKEGVHSQWGKCAGQWHTFKPSPCYKAGRYSNWMWWKWGNYKDYPLVFCHPVWSLNQSWLLTVHQVNKYTSAPYLQTSERVDASTICNGLQLSSKQVNKCVAINVYNIQSSTFINVFEVRGICIKLVWCVNIVVSI